MDQWQCQRDFLSAVLPQTHVQVVLYLEAIGVGKVQLRIKPHNGNTKHILEAVEATHVTVHGGASL